MTQNMKDIKWIAGENKVKDFKADFLPTPFDRYKSNKLSYNQKETEKKKLIKDTYEQISLLELFL